MYNNNEGSLFLPRIASGHSCRWRALLGCPQDKENNRTVMENNGKISWSRGEERRGVRAWGHIGERMILLKGSHGRAMSGMCAVRGGQLGTSPRPEECRKNAENGRTVSISRFVVWALLGAGFWSLLDVGFLIGKISIWFMFYDQVDQKLTWSWALRRT